MVKLANVRGHTIRQIAGITDDAKFMRRLAALDAAQDMVPWGQRKGRLTEFSHLNAFANCVKAGGMRQFLERSDGDGFYVCLAACERIGAQSAAKLFRDVAALFPRGRVPTTQAEREDAIQDIDDAAALRKRSNPIDAFERRIPTALRSLLAALRRDVTRDAEALAQLVASSAQGSTSQRRERRDKLFGEASEQLALAAHKRSRARSTQGGRNVDATALRCELVIQRLQKFVTSLRPLGASEWATIANRFAASPKSKRAAITRVESVHADGAFARTMEKGAYRRLLDRAIPLRDEAYRIVRNSLGDVRDANETVLHNSGQAVLFAWRTLVMLEWLIAEPEGSDAAKVLLEPFNDLADTEFDAV